MIIIFKKLRYKNEFKLLIDKLEFLKEEAIKGNSANADKVYWDLYLERLDKINKLNIIKDSNIIFNIYKDIYNRYIK